MSKLIAVMSVSLDGFVAGPGDRVTEVFRWYFHSGDVAFHAGGASPMTFRVSAASAAHLKGLWGELGAVLTGRRTFEVAGGWGGRHAWGPAFVLTHAVPPDWPPAGVGVGADSDVHFVTDGIESAVKRAKAAAGGKCVGVHGPATIRQLLAAGLLDELHIDLAAVFLGSGVRLFEDLAAPPPPPPPPPALGTPTVTAGVGVTHLRYPVLKR
ncbi:MAG: dihydrofolate reductase family protein [Phycisphaerae bacterium]